MPDYTILFRENEAEQQRMAPSETKALVEGHAAYVRHLKASGAYRDSERLRPSSEGKRVHARKVEAGPFGDEQAIAGYYLVKADNLDAAVARAEPCPLAPGDTLDVRPLMGGDVRADKTSRQGKTFAFAVLGNAASEQARVVSRGHKRTVMDGPFLESKEVIGGLFFMRMADLDEAVRWASATKFMRNGALEIRELWRS